MRRPGLPRPRDTVRWLRSRCAGPLALVLLAGCGGGVSGNTDGGGGDGGGGAGDAAVTPCEQVGQAFCDQACACTDGVKCAINDDGVVFSFTSDTDCRELLVTLACAGGAAGYTDPVACLALVQAAQCTGMGPMRALASPVDPACDPPP